MNQKKALLNELSKRGNRVDIIREGEVYSHLIDSKSKAYLIRLRLKIRKILPGIKFLEIKPQVKFGKKDNVMIYLYCNYKSFELFQKSKSSVNYDKDIGISGKGYNKI